MAAGRKRSSATEPGIADTPLATALTRVLRSNFPQLDWATTQHQAIAPLLSGRALGAGELLFAQGQRTTAFFAVLDGEIETRFTAEDGHVSAIEMVSAPRLFGFAAFATQQPSRYEALATCPTRLLVLGNSAYEYLTDQVPGFARALLRELALRFDGTLHLLETSRHASAAERLSLALQQLRRHGNTPPDEQGWLRLPTTQAELAALAQVSRQTGNEWLRQQADQGSLRLGYGCLWVRT
ncbi:MAG: Crp/Fnr family transcriptional regulator [Burkholderiaceae bacterium]|nr:Crp/Fnr family transcriptional regulator [Burkholderiaceae bacterium]